MSAQWFDRDDFAALRQSAEQQLALAAARQQKQHQDGARARQREADAASGSVDLVLIDGIWQVPPGAGT